MELATVGAIVTIFITIFTFFYKLIIVPLSDAITDLQNMIKELRLDFQKENNLRNHLLHSKDYNGTLQKWMLRFKLLNI